MSVYSGFSTRKLEKDYGTLTSSLISLLAYKLISIYKDVQVNEENWVLKFLNIHSQLAKLENNKHLPPKFSPICDDLVRYFNEKFSFPSLQQSPSWIPPQAFKLPEIKKGRDLSVELIPKNNERVRQPRASMAPSPKQLKSDYYERALERYFDLTQQYEKSDEKMRSDLTKQSHSYQLSHNSESEDRFYFGRLV
jgi:hypothetical protein